MAKIHPTAIVSDNAKLADSVEVGPYAIIGDHVTIGPNTKVGEFVTIKGHTTIGAGNIFHKGTSIGEPAQDVNFDNWDGKIFIGDNNTFRENCTVHLPSRKENTTTIGSGGYFMVNAHVAHDCVVGNGVFFINNCCIGGYVQVGNGAYISAASNIVQWLRMGDLAILGADSKASQDIPPYVMATGTTAVAHGLNLIGMKRAGFSKEEISAIKEAFKLLYLSKLSVKNALKAIEEDLFSKYASHAAALEKLTYFVEFIRESKKGIISYSEKHKE
ncbi:MAG: acyl-ACP--UDP-N-acetylglucosamine O-acyltransferase [Candidatus Hydrogenedentota bacterium]|nr:MAG: acyl-ACP--UDP-N-acetylglucosamine O-acyltransferase [Candidatus Hydrogenedentota bacterium]